MNVLVVGATGVMGRETTRLLLASGNKVRAMTRTPETAAGLQKMGAEVVRGDLIDPGALASACKGMFAVVACAHGLLGSGVYSSEAVDLKGNRALVDAAKAAGVEQFVFASIQGVSRESPLDFSRHKAATEQHLMASGMKYTILRPPAFMEWHAHTFLGKDILEKGKATILGTGKKPANFISGADVAKYAVIGLTDPRARNRILEIGGPDNISRNDLAEMYMRLSGKQARISHLPPVMLRVMSVVMKPVKPEVARIMLLSYLNEFTDQTFDPRKILAEFPMELLCLEDFVKARVAEWKAAG